jgi:hypothetical protein
MESPPKGAFPACELKQRLKHGFIALAVMFLIILVDVAIPGPKAKAH